jgi:hypothetical protein
MTQWCDICISLLKGETMSIMTGFKDFLCTNIPRELSRGVEKKFGVKVSREPVHFKSTYGRSGIYFRYRLNRTQYNAPGIEKMKAYIKEQLENEPPAKTQAQAKFYKQAELILK